MRQGEQCEVELEDDDDDECVSVVVLEYRREEERKEGGKRGNLNGKEGEGVADHDVVVVVVGVCWVDMFLAMGPFL